MLLVAAAAAAVAEVVAVVEQPPLLLRVLVLAEELQAVQIVDVSKQGELAAAAVAT